jgi:hypothetical protein
MRGKSLETSQEALGGRRGCGLREHVLQLALGVCLGLALRAGGEVGQNPLACVMTELPVHQGGESVPKMLVGDGTLAGNGP